MVVWRQWRPAITLQTSRANSAANHLLGVVMFDGVATNSAAFATAIANLKTLNIPDYVVAAPPQAWNASGATTSQLVSLYPGQFVGVELVNGSHVDSLLGDKPLVDFLAQLITQFSPDGNTVAVYTLSTGWIDGIYRGRPHRPDLRCLRTHRRLPVPRRPADHPWPGRRDRTAVIDLACWCDWFMRLHVRRDQGAQARQYVTDNLPKLMADRGFGDIGVGAGAARAGRAVPAGWTWSDSTSRTTTPKSSRTCLRACGICCRTTSVPAN